MIRRELVPIGMWRSTIHKGAGAGNDRLRRQIFAEGADSAGAAAVPVWAAYAVPAVESLDRKSVV